MITMWFSIWGRFLSNAALECIAIALNFEEVAQDWNEPESCFKSLSGLNNSQKKKYQVQSVPLIKDYLACWNNFQRKTRI